MKRSIYLTLLMLVTCACIVIGIIIHSNWRDSYNLFDFSTNQKIVTSQQEVNDFHSIQLDVQTLDVEVKHADSYSVSYTGAKVRKPEYSVKNDTLIVKQSHHTNIVFFPIGIQNSSKLIITVPKTADMDEFTLNNNVGELIMDGLTLNKATLSTDTGNIKIMDSSLKRAKLEADTGDIEMKDVSVEEVDSSTDTGDIDISCTGEKSDYEFDLATDVGDVTVNDKEYGHEYDPDTSAPYSIKADSDVGDVNITFDKE